MWKGAESFVGLKREGTGERVINRVRVQLHWKDRLARVEKGIRLSSTGLYSWASASRGVALGGRPASWQNNPPALPRGLKYGRVFTVESGGLYRVCFTYAVGRWSVDKIEHSRIKISDS